MLNPTSSHTSTFAEQQQPNLTLIQYPRLDLILITKICTVKGLEHLIVQLLGPLVIHIRINLCLAPQGRKRVLKDQVGKSGRGSNFGTIFNLRPSWGLWNPHLRTPNTQCHSYIICIIMYIKYSYSYQVYIGILQQHICKKPSFGSGPSPFFFWSLTVRVWAQVFNNIEFRFQVGPAPASQTRFMSSWTRSNMAFFFFFSTLHCKASRWGPQRVLQLSHV